MKARNSLINQINPLDESFENSRVKLAVLDTGIDWKDPLIRGAEDRIMEWKNWADDRKGQGSPQQVHDSVGHGTHITALLLDTAPEAKLYIGRVSDEVGAIIAPERIAEVSLPLLWWSLFCSTTTPISICRIFCNH